MPLSRRSLLDTRSLTEENLYSLFSLADVLRERGKKNGFYYQPGLRPPEGSKIVALLFLEPSTRTRLSFQTAAYRLGLPVTVMEPAGSSVVKGETLADTVLNITSMQPDALVVRWGSTTELDEILPSLETPVINAGSGTLAHPTQALLDAYTILKERGSVRGERVLIVGDVRHSRVAHSNFEVLSKLGAEIAVCGPDYFLPQAKEGIRIFCDLDEGLKWATVCMGLRIQFERHEAGEDLKQRLTDYHLSFGISPARLQSFSQEGILMHPGPINHGVEFDSRVLQDPRCRVLEQVTNGVLIRAAVLTRVLDLEPEGTTPQASSGEGVGP